jgi:putative sigma-54 modulation protein
LARGRRYGKESARFKAGGKMGAALAGFLPETMHSGAMKLVLSTHNITLTDAIEQHILEKLDQLEHLDRWTVDARVTLEHDRTRAPQKAFTCSVRLGVRGPDLFAQDSESDLYAAIDKVAKKVEQQIRKRHNKHKNRKHSEAARRKAKLKEVDA